MQNNNEGRFRNNIIHAWVFSLNQSNRLRSLRNLYEASMTAALFMIITFEGTEGTKVRSNNIIPS